MSRGPQAPIVKLSEDERESLQALIRRGTAAQRDVQRAKLALLVHEGCTTSAIATALSPPSLLRSSSAMASGSRHGQRIQHCRRCLTEKVHSSHPQVAEALLLGCRATAAIVTRFALGIDRRAPTEPSVRRC